MRIIDEARQEFIAKNLADLGKGILLVGFASYFFERLPVWLRVAFVGLGCLFFVTSIFILPRKGGTRP